MTLIAKMSSHENTEWCCDAMKYRLENPKELGLVIFVTETSTSSREPRFFIGTRTVDQADFETLRQQAVEMSVTMNLNSCTGLKFCPWCGVLLKDFYKSCWQALVKPTVVKEFIGFLED